MRYFVEHIVLVGQILNNDEIRSFYKIDKSTGVIGIEFDLGKIKYLIETISGSIKAKAYSKTMVTKLENIQPLDLSYKKGIDKITFSCNLSDPEYSFKVVLNTKTNECSFCIKRKVKLKYGIGINAVEGSVVVKRKD